MDFAPHLRQVFAIRGKPARYIPVIGSEISGFKAVRQGGGQPIQIGPVRITLERISFDVMRADLPTPAAGAGFEVGGETFTIDAVQPAENDVDALKWCLHVSWGAAVIYRSVTGSGATQNPPIGSTFTLNTAASAGVNAVAIKGVGAVGQLTAGDRFSLAGDPTVYTVGMAAQFSAGVAANVPISPVLSANAAAGAAVNFQFQRDYPLRAAVAGYAASEVMGGVLVGDRRLVVMQQAIAAALQAPVAGNRVFFENRWFTVQNVTGIYQGASPFAWDLQLRA